MNKIEILLVEDNSGDIRLIKEAFKETKIPNKLHVVGDGLEAISFLRNEGKYMDEQQPDLIILDLNLPKKDGYEVLTTIKQDKSLKKIPVLILSVSAAEEDIKKSYECHANCFIKKPVDMDQFIDIIKSIGNFWFEIVKLPPKEHIK